MKKILKLFWEGQTPMWFNVWILGLVFFRLLFIGIFIVIDEYELNITLHTVGLGLLPLYVVWAIATWRSAQIYKGKKLWSSLTELFVIIKCGGHIVGLFFIDLNFVL